VKPKFEKITEEVNILVKKAEHIRRYKYTIEQNLSPLNMHSKVFKNPWLLMKRLQKEPILMGHDIVQAFCCAGSVAILLVDVQGACLC
jgi:hypothetical protein